MSGSYKEERLNVDISELEEKIDKLKTFINVSESFYQLDDLNRSLLLSQLSVMYTYHSILQMRIDGVPK